MSEPEEAQTELVEPTRKEAGGEDEAYLMYGERGRVKLRPHQLQELMRRYKAYRKEGRGVMDACERVAAIMGIKPNTVFRAQQRLLSTTDLATDILKSNAAKLALRLVRKAGPDQAIEILSRTNMGVLAPAKESNGGGGTQFIIGVQADSLGAVKVGVQIGPSPTAEVNQGSVIDYSQPEQRAKPARILREKPVQALPPLPEPMPTVARRKSTVEAHQKAILRSEKSAKRKEQREMTERMKAMRAEIEAKRRGQ